MSCWIDIMRKAIFCNKLLLIRRVRATWVGSSLVVSRKWLSVRVHELCSAILPRGVFDSSKVSIAGEWAAKLCVRGILYKLTSLRLCYTQKVKVFQATWETSLTNASPTHLGFWSQKFFMWLCYWHLEHWITVYWDFRGSTVIIAQYRSFKL